MNQRRAGFPTADFDPSQAHTSRQWKLNTFVESKSAVVSLSATKWNLVFTQQLMQPGRARSCWNCALSWPDRLLSEQQKCSQTVSRTIIHDLHPKPCHSTSKNGRPVGPLRTSRQRCCLERSQGKQKRVYVAVSWIFVPSVQWIASYNVYKNNECRKKCGKLIRLLFFIM